MIQKKTLRNIAVIGGCVAVAGLAAALTASVQPASSPFRQDILTLRNDVGEKIVLPKATVKPLPKEAKSLIESLAADAKSKIRAAGTPVTRDDSFNCAAADSSLKSASEAESNAREWRSNEYGSSLVEMYDAQAREARASASESERKCQIDLGRLKAERNRTLAESQASKELIRLASSPGKYSEVVPTYGYKILVTDVNGRTRVIQQQTTCLNDNAMNLFSQEQRKQIAAYSFVTYDKPESMAIVTDVGSLSGLGVDPSAALIPTTDAINYASQVLCGFKGHRTVEPSLGKR